MKDNIMSPDLKNNLIILTIVCFTLFILYKVTIVNKIADQEQINAITNDNTLLPEEKENLLKKRKANSGSILRYRYN